MRDINDYTREYLKGGFEEYQVRYRRKKVLQFLREYQSRKILEIGCGMEPLFSYYDAFDMYCLVEPSKSFFDNAMKKKAEDIRIMGYNTYFTAIEGISNKKWDMIICSSLLHEVDDPTNLLNEIIEVCNRESIVHINVPNAKSFHRMLAYEAGIISELREFSGRNHVLQQRTVFDITFLKQMVEKAGFEIIEEGSFFIKPFTHDQMYKMMEDGIIDERILDGLYNMEKYLPDYGSEIYVNARRRD